MSERLERRCEVCRRSFQDCPHSIQDEKNHRAKQDQKRELTVLVRKIVREELSKAGLLPKKPKPVPRLRESGYRPEEEYGITFGE